MRCRLAVMLALLAASAAGQSPPPAEAAAVAAEPTVIEAMRAEAAAMRPLVQSSLAQAFLQATTALPEMQPRTVFANADRSHWYTAQQAAALPADERATLTERTLDASFYWSTRYGTPVAYARAVDLAAQRMAPGQVAFSTMVDFGCGGLGAPRMLASLGSDVVGVDVDPLLPAFYSEAGDTGAIPASAPGGKGGTLTLVTGQWPAEPAAADAVRAALPKGVDLFLSKNTLKHGYIHPAEPVDPRRLVHLGVSDEEFLAAVFAALRPGGLFMIYNLCPAPAAAGQPYIPWADGHCPFPREMLEAAGLQVLDFDVVDDEAARAMGHALGWDQGANAMTLEDDLFAWFTVARRPVAGDPK